MRAWTLRYRLAAAAVLGVLGIFLIVYPARAWFGQQQEFDQVRKDLAAIQTQNRELEIEANKLQLPSEIERQARERFGMVRPGEQAFVVQQVAPTTTTVPARP
jgi:cell division protein FtsB